VEGVRNVGLAQPKFERLRGPGELDLDAPETFRRHHGDGRWRSQAGVTAAPIDNEAKESGFLRHEEQPRLLHAGKIINKQPSLIQRTNETSVFTGIRAKDRIDISQLPVVTPDGRLAISENTLSIPNQMLEA